MSLHRKIGFVAILTLAPLLLAPSGQAAFHPRVAVRAEDDGAALLVNDRLVARLRAPNAGMSPVERTEVAADRLRAAISKGLVPAAVGVRKVGNEFAVTLGTRPLIVATREEAGSSQIRAPVLAGLWTRRLRAALALPGLTLDRSAVLIPYEEERAVPVGGVATGDFSVSVGDERIVAAEVDLTRGALVVRGRAPGATTVRLDREGATASLRIVVRKYAGQVLEPVEAQVTGRPAPAELVVAQALGECRRGLALEPGARIVSLEAPRWNTPLEPGATVTFALAVAMGGPGYLKRRADLTVRVHNYALPPREADVLLYSNDPEQVRQFGILYHGCLEGNGPARLLYHHQNRMGRAFYLTLDLINPSDQPAHVQVIEGAAQPMVDTVLVGQRAATRYLRRALRDVGALLEVPAGSRRTILVQRVPTKRTASGIYGLRTFDGPPVFVQLLASTERVTSPTRSAGRGTVTVSDHVYPSPNKEVRARYRVGEHWAFVSLGKRAIDGRHPQRRLDGNYGVFYDIQFDIENPTSDESMINLVLVPDAGAARGVFLIAGRLIEVPQVTPPAEFVLASFRVKPVSRGRVSIRTLPVGGSAYPVTLVVRVRRPGEARSELGPEIGGALPLRGGSARLTETQSDEVSGK